MAGVRNYIGTSGFSYPHWVGPFYPEDLPAKGHLKFYCEHFDTVEINASFYRLPSQTAVEAWHRTAGPDFTFSLKGSRFITHNKKLADPDEAVARFFESLAPLGDSLGVVVFQLPPHWRKDTERLDAFLAVLPEGTRYAVELRDHSWLEDDVLDVLKRHHAAFCIYDLAGFETPHHVTAGFVYLRLHGPSEAKYSGSHSDERLHAWAEEIQEWNRQDLSVYCYFDNDQKGYAVQNALKLRELLEAGRPRHGTAGHQH